ncbi:MAG: hypothetical protein KDA86_02800 [Planctomycetaceae bacterium]|nr:hypothetical protein [Planctomycetaceae bacterium]
MNTTPENRETTNELPNRPSRVVRLLLAMTSPADLPGTTLHDEFPFLPMRRSRLQGSIDARDSQLIDRRLLG